MNRLFVTAALSALCLMLALQGCQKTADQQQAAATDPNSSSSTPASGASSSKPAREAPPRPRPLVVPAETVIAVVLDERVGSKISTPGQNFSATVREPVEVDGRVAIPKGARATGIMKDAKPAGRFQCGASLELTLVSIEVNGTNYDVHTTAPTEASKGKGKRTAAMVGGGAGGGALIGGLAGRGKGGSHGGLTAEGGGTGRARQSRHCRHTPAGQTP